MKKTLTLLLIFIVSVSQADFIDASENYDKGNYQQAYTEFLKLAQLGNVKSQYNVAVMLSNGQGVENNLIEAYAWAKLVSNNEKYKPLLSVISKGLTAQELTEAEQLYSQYHEKYFYENSKVILGPVIVDTDTNTNKNIYSGLKVIPIKKMAPNYPKNMLISRVQGWVSLRFMIYPDKSIRDIYIDEEWPLGAFGKAAVASVEKYKYTFEKNGTAFEPDEPISVSTNISFRMANTSSILNRKQKDYFKKLYEKAENGDVSSQYQYALVQDRYFKQDEIDEVQTNEWLFSAAQEGIIDAQYQIGQNIYYGKSCKIQKQKGLDWIMNAAQVGNAKAQYMAYYMLKGSDVINQSGQKPFYWLEQAAKNGLSIAQLLYAKEIANKAKPSKSEINLAKDYIKNYAKNTYKTTQWYQISALIEHKLGSHRKALSKIKSAYRLAKAYKWDLSELEQQKETWLCT